MAHCLQATDLSKKYRRRAVVDHVSLQVNKGEIVGLLGPNGAGKTTTFYMVVGLIKPDGGQVYLDQRQLTEEPMYRRARSGISYLPQEASVFRRLTVEQNLGLVLQQTRLSKPLQKERLDSLLAGFGLEQVRQTPGYALSGGERRRVEIARALVLDPAFLLLDEPFAGIDPIAVEDLQQLLQRLQTQGIGILISDHNVRETLTVCDRAYLLNEGQILQAGDPQSIAASAEARQIYLGQRFVL